MRLGLFPRPVCVGGQVAWVSSEFEVWFSGLPRQRYKGDSGYVAPDFKRGSKGQLNHRTGRFAKSRQRVRINPAPDQTNERRD